MLDGTASDQHEVLIFPQGTTHTRNALLSNIEACQAIARVVRSTYGPRGMDKLIYDKEGNITITNGICCTVCCINTFV